MNAKKLAACEAQWVVDGIDTVCGKPASRLTHFEDRELLTCDECATDLGHFERFHAEQALAGPRDALESWVGPPR